jgi:hypothetical protein
MHKMNGQSFIAQKWGLNARMGVEHYSAPESNIYSVRVWGRAAWGDGCPWRALPEAVVLGSFQGFIMFKSAPQCHLTAPGNVL